MGFNKYGTLSCVPIYFSLLPKYENGITYGNTKNYNIVEMMLVLRVGYKNIHAFE